MRGGFQGCESTVRTQRHVQAGLPPTPFWSPPTTLGLTFLLKDTTMHSKFSSPSSPSIGDDEMALAFNLLQTLFHFVNDVNLSNGCQIDQMCSICLFHSHHTRRNAFTTSPRHPIQFRISESWVLDYFSVDSC